MGECCSVDKRGNLDETRTIIQTIKLPKKAYLIENHHVKQNHKNETSSHALNVNSSHQYIKYLQDNDNECQINKHKTTRQLGEMSILITKNMNDLSINRYDTVTHNKSMLMALGPLAYDLNAEKFSINEGDNKLIDFEFIDREIQDVFS